MSAGQLLTERERRFLDAFFASKNKVQSYMYAFPNSSYNSARSSASDVLAKPNAKDYLKELENKAQAVTAIVVNANLDLILMTLRRYESISVKASIIIDKKWPDVNDDEAIKKMSPRDIKDIIYAAKLAQDNIIGISELRHQLTGAAAVQQEIFNKIEKNEWYIQNKDELEADESEPDDLSDRG